MENRGFKFTKACHSKFVIKTMFKLNFKQGHVNVNQLGSRLNALTISKRTLRNYVHSPKVNTTEMYASL